DARGAARGGAADRAGGGGRAVPQQIPGEGRGRPDGARSQTGAVGGAMSAPQPLQEFFSIGEVCQLTDLKPHVLRYWESQFRFLNPAKNRSGNRVYQRREIELIMLVKHLLYTEKYTIEGARQKIEQYRRSGELKPEAQLRQRGPPADRDRARALGPGPHHRHPRRGRAARSGGHRAARGSDPERRGRSGTGRPRAWRDNAPGPALQQLALRCPRVPHRRRNGAGRADRLPGDRSAAGRGDPTRRAGLRLRDRVPARDAGRGPARAVGAGTHALSGAAQSFPPLGGYLAPGAGFHALRASDHFRSAMNILISNDDGILARGLAVLGEVCAALGQVTVVAPDREQSGTSHSLTLHR